MTTPETIPLHDLVILRALTDKPRTHYAIAIQSRKAPTPVRECLEYAQALGICEHTHTDAVDQYRRTGHPLWAEIDDRSIYKLDIPDAPPRHSVAPKPRPVGRPPAPKHRAPKHPPTIPHHLEPGVFVEWVAAFFGVSKLDAVPVVRAFDKHYGRPLPAWDNLEIRGAMTWMLNNNPKTPRAVRP